MNVYLYPNSDITIVQDGGDEESGYVQPSLRDLAIIGYSLIGGGVFNQLARALAKRLDIDRRTIWNALIDVFREYSELPVKVGQKRWKMESQSLFDKDDEK